MKRNLLLISNSTNAGEEYLAWPLKYITGFLSEHRIQNVSFIPFAGVSLSDESLEDSYNWYEAKVGRIFRQFGINIHSIHREKQPVSAVQEADAIMVGGGNTFHLVARMHELGLMEPIRNKILAGMPYIGWSAGANVACPTMKTTNDMPIYEPPSFSALNVVPFQINPHYLDANPQGHAGETRQQRIEEFLTVNRDITVVGLREGCFLEVRDDSMKLTGQRSLRVFRFGKEPEEIQPGEPLDRLLMG